MKKSEYYENVCSEIRQFQNINCILEKIEADGNVSLIGKTFEHIFDKEIIYAVSELKKLRKK